MPQSAKKFSGTKSAAKTHKTESAPRGTAAQRGYGGRWQRARLVFLQENPLCETCGAKGYVVEATTVDHKTPHRGNQQLFWDASNWSALCSTCHNRKTGKGS